jgi:hypothetical protein
MSIEAMKMALEFIESRNKSAALWMVPDTPLTKTVTALRAAIEQAEKPVAWMYDFLNSDNRDEVIRDWMTQDYADIKREHGFNVRPLYTAPPATTQKPVAYVDERIHGWPDCFVMEPDPPHTVPLYTAPQEWVELTDDEARALVNRATFGDRTNWQALVYMVDAKLKEKNHG